MSQDARCHSHGIVCFLRKERGLLVFAPHVASWQHAPSSVPSAMWRLSVYQLSREKEIAHLLRTRERTGSSLFFAFEKKGFWGLCGVSARAIAMVSKARAGAKAKQKADPMPADNTAAAPRTLSYSLKSKKAGRQLEVMVQIPRSTPSSVLSIEADEQGLRVDTGKWGGGYALAFEWPAPFTGKVRAGKDIEVHKCLRIVGLDWCMLCAQEMCVGDGVTVASIPSRSRQVLTPADYSCALISKSPTLPLDLRQRAACRRKKTQAKSVCARNQGQTKRSAKRFLSQMSEARGRCQL